MQLSLSSHELTLAVQRLSGGGSDKKFAYYSLKAEINDNNSSLIIASTEASLDIYSEHNCSVQQAGQCHILCHKFIETVRQLPKGQVQLTCEEKFLVISMQETHHSVEIKLPIIEGYVWVEKQQLDSVVSSPISSAQLSYMISQVVFNLIPDPTLSYADLGYLHQTSVGVLRLVATDTFKLSYCDIHTDLPENFLTGGVCLSKKALNMMTKVCEQQESMVLFRVSDSQKVCHLKVSGYDVFVRASYMNYPHYTQLIPQTIPPPLIFDKEVLIGMIKRAAISVDYSKIVTFQFVNNTMTIIAYDEKSKSGLEGVETLAIEYSQDPLSFGINSDALLNTLSHIMSSHIALSIKNDRSPLVLYGATEPGDCVARHVMAPVAIPKPPKRYQSLSPDHEKSSDNIEKTL